MMNEAEQAVFDAIYGRRSVRSYVEGKPVEPEKILNLLKAAMAAPSACNIQPWDFIVVTEPERLDAIRASIAQFGSYNAPLAIVVCSYPGYIPWEGDDGVVDCSAATENMLIAAKAMGLGSVWIGGFDSNALRQILEIPATAVPKAMVYFGYPVEQPEPRTKYLEEAVHWQKYDAARPHPTRPGNILA
jgi:nitroreductase